MSYASATEADQFSELIGAIYDAVLDPSRWPSVLEQCCVFVGGCSANIFWQRADRHDAVDLYSWNEDLDYRRLYAETYGAMNPFLPALSVLEPGVVFSGADLLPREEFVATRFYKEWVRPQGWVDVLGANLDRSNTSFAMFSIRRDVEQGVVDEEAKRRLGLLIPHVRRAALIGQLIDQQKLMSESLTETLRGLSVSVFLVDAENRIAFVNSPGQAMLDAGIILCRLGDQLAAANANADLNLREAIDAASKSGSAIGAKGTFVLLSESSSVPWVATVLPLHGNASGAGATAAIFVRQIQVDVTGAVAHAAERYGLTAAETRVLRAIVESTTVDEIATALETSRSTVKTHLEHLFRKTGAKRRIDLVRVLLGFGEAQPSERK